MNKDLEKENEIKQYFIKLSYERINNLRIPWKINPDNGC